MITFDEAHIAAETLCDVFTPNGDLGVIDRVLRTGTNRGRAYVQCGYGDGVDRVSGWFLLSEITLPAASRKVVARYL